MPSSEKNLTQKRGPTWALIFAFWTLIAVLYASQNVFSSYSQGREIDWARLISWSFTRWLLWAVLTPLVFHFVRHFPIERHDLRRGLSKQLVLGLVLALGQLILETATNYVVWLMADAPIQPLERFQSLLTYTFHVNLLVYWAIVGAAHALDYYRKFRERELQASQLKAKLTQAQLQALKAQIHPHFLFNTHHAILSLMLKKENEAAMKMLTRLSDLLRLSLENTTAHEVSLKQELEFLNLYLEIQQTRFQDRLQVQMEIAPDTLHACIPNLIMQPLVENAIQHGIAPHSSAGVLEIRATRDNPTRRQQWFP
jgi:hypothetical protein